MALTLSTASPARTLILGILILIFPQFLNYFIALYLIFTGLVGLGILG